MSDRAELSEEYQKLASVAVANHVEATAFMDDGDPRRAQVHATLAVAARIDALTYLLSKAKVF